MSTTSLALSGLLDALTNTMLDTVGDEVSKVIVGGVPCVLPALPAKSVQAPTVQPTLPLLSAGAEYVARLLPPGTHDWGRFVNPDELTALADAAGLDLARLAGMAPVGPWMRWALTDDPGVNYIASFVKRGGG